jgi:hypothetical protein
LFFGKSCWWSYDKCLNFSGHVHCDDICPRRIYCLRLFTQQA